MSLYTERHGIRAPREKTYVIDRDMYSLLLECCNKYKNNLTHIFIKRSHHDFTNSDYIEFNEQAFLVKVKIKIPSLFRDEYDRICTPSCDDEFDQFALLDLIEFFAQNMKDIIERWNNPRYQNFKTIDCLKTAESFYDFKDEINEIFVDAGLLYKLTDEKIVERIIENSPLTVEIKNNFSQISEVGTKELLKDAIDLYKTPNYKARQDSVEKIWDALERLKTYYATLDKKGSAEKIVYDMANGDRNYIELFNNEFLALTKIGNKFRIRHHETDKIDITDVRYYDYFFNRCLSLIALAVQYLI